VIKSKHVADFVPQYPLEIETRLTRARRGQRRWAVTNPPYALRLRPRMNCRIAVENLAGEGLRQNDACRTRP
jgi:hypothetical protein